ncbi:MAG: T9SS type A sorting domain-containing protein [Bacteroidales bacterium]|jgi:hypothetical protein|nr:T9SS type A sorting domain-containing protein [Bacteroidales bacterium]
MKKILSLAAVASLTLAANAEKSPYQGKNYADWGKLKLVGNQLSDRDGNPVQLKGWSTYSLHFGEVQGCLGEGQWKLMQQYGANVVRLAMYVDAPNSYLDNEAMYKEFIKTCIEETSNLNMYCIVDWHILEQGNGSGDPNDYINESKDFFGEISYYCADNGYDHVLYEICNEPICGWTQIKSYAEDVIPVITTNQPDAIVIVGTDQWCQKIMEPVTNPISSDYKKNVMYSFHYYACTHKYLLGEFRKAQNYLPVFVSEWSAVNFSGEGPFCRTNSDELIADCDYKEAAPQVVSWCVWNWGKKDDASSFFTGSCNAGYESKFEDRDESTTYGHYIMDLFSPMGCCTPPPCCAPWVNMNKIPTKVSSLWHWDYYDMGGEAETYHDANSDAWVKDSTGNVIDYSRDGEEVDVLSLARAMQWLDKPCPWSTVEDNRVVDFDSTISTNWKDENGNPTYKSLNAGRNYSGSYGSNRPDDGVDLNVASCMGTAFEYSGYNSLYKVEENEWINYTVNVAKAGYYKISGIVSAEYKAPLKNGEISIKSDYGNHLRDTSALNDDDVITSFGFPRTTVCDDPTVPDSAYWDCWTRSDAISGDHKEVLCKFEKAGEQRLTIEFLGDASGVGPLIFEWYADLDPNEFIVCGDCGGDYPGAVDDIETTKFSINPNPTSGEFSISLADNVEAMVDVVNTSGQVVVSQNVKGTATINKSLASGIYTVIVKFDGAVRTQKLVVK